MQVCMYASMHVCKYASMKVCMYILKGIKKIDSHGLSVKNAATADIQQHRRIAYLHTSILAYMHNCILVYMCILAYLHTCILA